MLAQTEKEGQLATSSTIFGKGEYEYHAMAHCSTEQDMHKATSITNFGQGESTTGEQTGHYCGDSSPNAPVHVEQERDYAIFIISYSIFTASIIVIFVFWE